VSVVAFVTLLEAVVALMTLVETMVALMTLVEAVVAVVEAVLHHSLPLAPFHLLTFHCYMAG